MDNPTPRSRGGTKPRWQIKVTFTLRWLEKLDGALQGGLPDKLQEAQEN